MAGEKVMSGNARWSLDGKTVFHATECTLSLTRATKERSTKDTDGRELAKGIKSFSLSSSHLVVYGSDGIASNDFAALTDIFNDDTDTRIAVVFTPSETDKEYTLEGEGIMTSLEGNFVNEEDGTSSLTIEGGSMTKVEVVV